jgi:hypothetical protein
MVALPFQWCFLLGQPIGVALALTAGLAAGVAAAPMAAALALAAVGLLAAASKEARSYLFMNATMFSAIVALVAGRPLTDRWPRDRDAGWAAPGSGRS